MTAPHYSDVCEGCLALDRTRTVVPPANTTPNQHGLIADYLCHRCGHIWTCGWAEEAAA
ncbi:hypothetical protein ACWEG1_05805 [Streptomyces bauhiniae]